MPTLKIELNESPITIVYWSEAEKQSTATHAVGTHDDPLPTERHHASFHVSAKPSGNLVGGERRRATKALVAVVRRYGGPKCT